jgi:hypothetical protein
MLQITLHFSRSSCLWTLLLLGPERFCLSYLVLSSRPRVYRSWVSRLNVPLTYLSLLFGFQFHKFPSPSLVSRHFFFSSFVDLSVLLTSPIDGSLRLPKHLEMVSIDGSLDDRRRRHFGSFVLIFLTYLGPAFARRKLYNARTSRFSIFFLSTAVKVCFPSPRLVRLFWGR